MREVNGIILERGRGFNFLDDRNDRWYWRAKGHPVPPRRPGPGWATPEEALAAARIFYPLAATEPGDE